MNLGWISDLFKNLFSFLDWFKKKTDELDNKTDSLVDSINPYYNEDVKARESLDEDARHLKKKTGKRIRSLLDLFLKSRKTIDVNYVIADLYARVFFHQVFYVSSLVLMQVENIKRNRRKKALPSISFVDIKSLLESNLSMHKSLLNEVINNFQRLHIDSLNKYFSDAVNDKGWNSEFVSLIRQINTPGVKNRNELIKAREKITKDAEDKKMDFIETIKKLINSKTVSYSKQVEGLKYLLNDEVFKKYPVLKKTFEDFVKEKNEVINACKSQLNTIRSIKVYDNKLNIYLVFLSFLASEIESESGVINSTSNILHSFLTSKEFVNRIPRAFKHVDINNRKKFKDAYIDYSIILRDLLRMIKQSRQKLTEAVNQISKLYEPLSKQGVVDSTTQTAIIETGEATKLIAKQLNNEATNEESTDKTERIITKAEENIKEIPPSNTPEQQNITNAINAIDPFDMLGNKAIVSHKG